MLTARTHLFHFVACAAIISLGCYGCNKPAETPSSPGPSSSGETETSSDHGLTAEAAQELLPSAASMSSADFEKLATASSPSPETIENQTLTWVLLTLNPLKTSYENATVLEDFNFPTGNALPQPSQIAEVIYKSKAKGYATFLQPDLITDCSCQSDGDTANGFVTFSAPDLFTGKVQFIARRNEGKWQIEEFLLPNYGIKTTLGTDNQWHQSGIDDPANRTDSTEAKKSESAPAAEAPAVGPPALTTAAARALVPRASSMSKLCVNIDHVATIRQARMTFEPSPIDAALAAIEGGADGITLHIREDRRHMQDADLFALKEILSVPLNLEMAATDEMVSLALETTPDMAMIVSTRGVLCVSSAIRSRPLPSGRPRSTSATAGR
jgi:hypothetical protein